MKPGATHADGPLNDIALELPSDAVLDIRRALFEKAQHTRDVAGPAREDVPGTGGLLQRGVAAVFFSERGQGKSSVALVAGLGAAAAGERVLYLDRENGARLTRERTDAILGANPDWGDPFADERFVGRHYAELRGSWQGNDFGEAIAGLGFSVVLYDSTREMLDQLGLDPNGDADVSKLYTLLVTPLRRRGVAVALLDNVGHQTRGRPKGSGTKLDATEQAYKVVTTARFSAVETGRIAIFCTRSRYGDEGREWSMRVGGGTWELPEASTDAPNARRAQAVSEQREAFRLVCLEALRECRPMGREALLDAVRKRGIKGQNQKLHEWLKSLAADPKSGIESTTNGYDLTAGDPGPESPGHPGATPVSDRPGPLAPPVRGAGAGDPGPKLTGGGAAGANGPILADPAKDEPVSKSPRSTPIARAEVNAGEAA